MLIDSFHDDAELRMHIDDASNEMDGAQTAEWDILDARRPEGTVIPIPTRQVFLRRRGADLPSCNAPNAAHLTDIFCARV